jgi:hypothetical protein
LSYVPDGAVSVHSPEKIPAETKKKKKRLRKQSSDEFRLVPAPDTDPHLDYAMPPPEPSLNNSNNQPPNQAHHNGFEGFENDTSVYGGQALTYNPPQENTNLAYPPVIPSEDPVFPPASYSTQGDRFF